jgi:hypothetical protein
MRCPLSLITVLLVTATAAMPQLDSDSNLKTLQGLMGVNVLVLGPGPEAEADGLKQTVIQTDVELRLRQAGIKVLTQTERLAAPGGPYLLIRADTLRIKSAPGLYAYSVIVELAQFIRLDHDPSIIARGTTWSPTGVIGIVGSGELNQIRDRIKDQVDRFINAWLSVNPK